MKTLNIYELIINFDDEKKSGCIKRGFDRTNEDSGIKESFNVAMDILESIILAHACSGVDVFSNSYTEGVKTVLDYSFNKYIA
jgi:hypothetical protein